MELSIIYYIKFDRVFTHKKKEFDYFYNEVAYTLKTLVTSLVQPAGTLRVN